MEEYLLDTSAILHNPRLIEEIHDSRILIPIETLKELDKHKYDSGTVGANARHFARFVDSLAMVGSLIEGVPSPTNGSTIFVLKNKDLFENADQAIINYKQGEHPVTVVTDDVYLRIISSTNGFKVKSCDDLYASGEVYSGIHECHVSPEELDAIYHNKRAYIEGLVPNQYAIIHSGKQCAFGRYHADLGYIPLLNGSTKLQASVQPRNIHQKFLVDAILDTNISLVTAHSIAGCGKTIISLATALYLVRIKQQYNHLVLAKPITPIGGDKLGFLPGSLDEKMKYWLLSYMDNLSMLQQEDLFDSTDISVCATMHMRGRSINNSIIIMDEMQNTDPSEVKTLITRVGENSKIICLGDITQIDNPKLNIYNNGLTYLINKMKGQEVAATIKLEANERSKLSDLAARIL